MTGLSALVAFGHFLAFFGLATALTLQVALVKPSPDIDTARRIQRSDRVYGITAVLILIFGFLRVFYFEKGADFYFGNIFFLVKLAVFVLVGLMTIYPTLTYLRWNKEIKRGVAPTFAEADAAKVRMLLHLQLIGICVVLFCASMMARGFGSFS